MKHFVIGLGLGLLAGLIFAPQKARKNRSELAQRAKQMFPEDKNAASAQHAIEPETEAMADVLNTEESALPEESLERPEERLVDKTQDVA